MPPRPGGSPRGGSPRGGGSGGESVALVFRECLDNPATGVRRLATSHAAMHLQRTAMLYYETARNNVGAVWRKYQSGELFSGNTVETVKIFSFDLAAKAQVQVGRAHLFCVQSLSRLPPPLVAPLLSSLTLLLLFLLWTFIHSPSSHISQFAPPASPYSSSASLTALNPSRASLTALNPSASIFAACHELLAAHGRAVATAVGADEGGPGAAAVVAAAAATAAGAAAADSSRPTTSPATAAAAGDTAAGAAATAGTAAGNAPPTTKPLIPGSTIRSPATLAAFQNRYACLATQGVWDLDPVPRPLPWFKLRKGWSGWECDAAWSRQSAETGNLAFTAADAVADEARHARAWQVRDAAKYRWRVNRRCGRWGAVDRVVLSEKLAGKRVMVVGDETNAMLFLSLRNHVLMAGGEGSGGGAGGEGDGGEGGGRGRVKAGGGYEGMEHLIVVRDEVPEFCARLDLQQQQDFPVCTQITFGDSASVLFVRDDVLRTSPPNPDPAAQDPSAGPADGPPSLSTPWFDEIQSNLSVLILNRGTHFVEDEKFISQLNDTLTKVRAAAPDMLIIYRSTPPGHARCDQLLAPIEERQDPSSLPNHWGEFGAQNEWAKRLVKEVGGVFLDVDPMTALRPDGHIRPPSDCLQYCLPGPPDEWTRMLYHMLVDLL